MKLFSYRVQLQWAEQKQITAALQETRQQALEIEEEVQVFTISQWRPYAKSQGRWGAADCFKSQILAA